MKFDKRYIEQKTRNKNYHMKQTLEFADQLTNDPYKKKRLEKSECLICYYQPYGKIGGSAITHSKCECCDKDLIFGSTCVGVLCSDCAKKHKVCKHCGANLDLSTKRRKYNFDEG